MYWSLPYWILDKIKRNQRSCSHVWISSNKDFTVCNNRRAKYLRKKVVIHCWMVIYIISTNIINKFNIVYNNMCVCGFLWKKLFKVKPHKELFEIKPEKLSSKIVNMFSVCYSNRVFVFKNAFQNSLYIKLFLLVTSIVFKIINTLKMMYNLIKKYSTNLNCE